MGERRIVGILQKSFKIGFGEKRGSTDKRVWSIGKQGLRHKLKTTAGVPGSDAVALVSGAPVQIILLHMQFPLFSALIDLKEVAVVIGSVQKISQVITQWMLMKEALVNY